MTTRRAFITGLLASAATGAAQACPAQPATVFFGADPAAQAAELNSVVTYPLGEIWTTEPIPYSAYAAVSRAHAKALIASFQMEKRGADAFNQVAP